MNNLEDYSVDYDAYLSFQETKWDILDAFLAAFPWDKLSKVIKLTYSKRETHDRHPHPHFDIPKALVDPAWLNIQIPCVKCGRLINPIRLRMKPATRDGVPYPTGAWISLTCRSNVNPSCFRTNESKYAVARLEHLLKNRVAG